MAFTLVFSCRCLAATVIYWPFSRPFIWHVNDKYSKPEATRLQALTIISFEFVDDKCDDFG